MAGFEPYYKKKFKSRKFRLDPTENYKLDKIRGSEGSEGEQHGKLNVLMVFIIALGVLILSFIIPRVANTVVTRRHTDACLSTKKTIEAMVAAGSTFSENTLFIVNQNNRYYLFWYMPGASITLREGARVYTDFIEIKKPDGYTMPVNVRAGMEIEYPFKEIPINIKDGNVKTMDGLELMDGYAICELTQNADFEAQKPKNVMVYQLVKVG